MKKAYILLVAFQMLFAISSYAQKSKDTVKNNRASVATALDLLNEGQKKEVRKVNKQFILDMKTLINQSGQNPVEKRAKIEKLKADRDSTLTTILGKTLFIEYKAKAVTRKK
jgi:uncharacterized protein YlzI (FlbEa/FlbD family)